MVGSTVIGVLDSSTCEVKDIPSRTKWECDFNQTNDSADLSGAVNLRRLSGVVVTVTDSRAFEGDGTLLFALEVSERGNDGTADVVPEISLDYTTVEGTASAGSDYTAVSGTLVIPAGTRRATVAVALLDDTADEAAETLTLQLAATGVVRGSVFYLGGTVAHFFVGSARTRIDYREAKALWAAADGVNAAVRSAAGRAGAHFVDVVGGVPLEDPQHGFVGHSSCNTADPWMHGFVAKEGLRLDISGADGSSFHPTAAGQEAFARILETYIRSRIDAGAQLSEAGLPLPTPPSSGTSRGVGSQQPAAAKQDDSGDTGTADGQAGEQSEAAPSVGLLCRGRRRLFRAAVRRSCPPASRSPWLRQGSPRTQR